MKRLIITNKAYIERPGAYRAAQALRRELAVSHVGKVLKLDFRPEESSVPESITKQIRASAHDILASDEVVLFMGDGGIALALHALQQLQTNVRVLAEKAIGIAPGGTMNNLHAALYANGNIGPHHAKPTVIREFSYSGDSQKAALPVVSFCGTGAEAEFLHHYEKGSRSNPREINFAIAGVGMAQDFWRTRNDPQESFAALAIPVWGIMKFPPEFYRLEQPDVAVMKITAQDGFEAASLFALYQVAGQSPDFLTWLWQKQGLPYQLASSVPFFEWFAGKAHDMKPTLIEDHQFQVRVTHPEGFLFHTDGTVHACPMPVGSTVDCRLKANELPPVNIYAA